ncbi:hypothetical protein [Starkeya nomas]|uniref:hypothetical protein n=1 Tax=Starkeya nomas TaxID=2666134 RepID=UPI001356C8CA|nr:hypothetical protein [Starkeya nomas]
MDKPWKDDFEEIDFHVSKLILQTTGSFLPAVAIAAALIDGGMVKRARLLEIITAVHDLALTDAAVGEDGEEMDALERLQIWLETIPMEEGTALEQLRLFATIQSARNLLARRSRPSDESA